MNSISTRALDIFGEWASARLRGQSLDFTPLIGEDPALRSEVERLIADSDTRHELPPDTARYMFRMFIARGGMGEVWRAFDLDLRREVAVKLLNVNTGGSVAQFHAEAQLVAKLEHPAIVPVYDSGVLKDGRPFFVMKLIQGKRRSDGSASPPPTLEQVLNNRVSHSHDLPRFTDVFQQICTAVAYAHSMKPPVVHRDLKPSNVMVGVFGEVLVTDWGLAKALFNFPGAADLTNGAPPADDLHSTDLSLQSQDTDVTNSSIVDTREYRPPAPDSTVDFQPGGAGFVKLRPDRSETKAGTVKGTPAYMAPEQARGENHLVGPPCDVFALGGILCHILTGQPVYLGEDMAPFWKAGQADLAETHARLDGCGADPALIAIARTCLSPNIADRPADAGALAQMIADFRAGLELRLRQVEMDRASQEAREAELRKRRRMQRILGGLVIGGLLSLLLGWMVWRSRMAEEAEKFRLAEVRRENAEQNHRDQEAMAHLMRGMEMVSSRRGNWAADARFELRQAKHIAASQNLGPQIRAALTECVSGFSLETAERLEPQAKISVAAYSADGRTLILAERFTNMLSGGTAAYFHDTATGRKLRTVVFPKSTPLANLTKWELERMRKPDGISAIALSRDGRRLVAGTRHGSVHIADLTVDPPTIQTGSWRPQETIERLEFSPDHRTLYALAGRRDGRLLALDPVTADIRREAAQTASHGFAIDPLSGEALALSKTDLVRLDPVSLAVRDKQPIGDAYVMALSPAGDMLAHSNGKQIFLTDIRRREMVREIRENLQTPAHVEIISALMFDPRGRFLVSSSEWSNEVKFWDLATGFKLLQVNAGQGLSKLAIHPEGADITVGSENGAIRHRITRTTADHARLTTAGMLLNFDLTDDNRGIVAALRRPSGNVRFEQWGTDSQAPAPLPGPAGLNLAEEDTLELRRAGQRLTGYASSKGYGWFDAEPPEPVFHADFKAETRLRFGPDGGMWAAGDEFLKLKRPGKAELSYRFVFDHFTKRNTVTGLGINRRNVLVGMQSGYAWVFPATLPGAATRIPTPTSVKVEHLTAVRALEPLDEATWLAGTRSGRMHRFELNEKGDNTINHRSWTAHEDEVTTFVVLSPEFVVTGSRDRSLALWRLTPSAEELLFRWNTTGPVRQLRHGSADHRLRWLNTGEHGIHELDLPALWKIFDDHRVGIQKPATWP